MKKSHPRGVATAEPLSGDPQGPWRFEPIGWIESPFREKFGIPRQPGLAREARGVIRLKDHDFMRRALEGLEGFSHLWAIWIFHEHDARDWKPSIRPPRLGGAKRVGVLASRAPHRPNPIGLSVFRILSIDAKHQDGPRIEVEGVDVLDGTPLLDLKPYLPYADSVPLASSGWASEELSRLEVSFSGEAQKQLSLLENGKELSELIVDVLALDPRPAAQKRRHPPGAEASEGLRYGFELRGWDVRWEIRAGGFHVREIVPVI